MSAPSRLPSIRRPGGSTNGSKSRPMSMIEGSLGFSLTGGSSSQSKPTTKTSKRRSLLPQFSSSKKGAVDEQPEIQEADEEESQGHTSASSSEANLVASVAQRQPPPQSTSRAARPLTMFVGNSAGASKLPGARTSSLAHSRGLSTASARPSTRDGALATLNGAPSVGPRISSRVETLPNRQTSAAQHIRQSSSISRSHARTNSSMTVSSIGGPREKRGSVSSIRPPSSSQNSPPRTMSHRSHLGPSSRAAFNTYQQHYSPAKSTLPKTPGSTNRTGRSHSIRSDDLPPGLSSEQFLHAQVELLQLSLMHQAAVESMREFDASAKQKLGRKHAKLRRDYESVRALEQEQQRVSNIAALDAWTPNADLMVENLRIVGKVKADIDLLTSKDGEYSKLVSSFETWIDEAEAILTRETTSFAERLQDTWHATHETLTLRVGALLRELERLPRIPRGPTERSSIGVLLASCRNMLADMARELKVMVQLEQEMLDREKLRLDDEIKSLNLTSEKSEPAKWTPAWQSVSA